MVFHKTSPGLGPDLCQNRNQIQDFQNRLKLSRGKSIKLLQHFPLLSVFCTLLLAHNLLALDPDLKTIRLVDPLAPTELRSDQLCPNPVDIQGNNVYPFFPIANHISVHKLLWPSNLNNSSIIVSKTANVPSSKAKQCEFQNLGKAGKDNVVLVTFERRKDPFRFNGRCKGVLEFPDISGALKEAGSESSKTTCNAEKGDHSGERNTMKFMTRRVSFQLPFEAPLGEYRYFAVLFRISSSSGNSGECYLQVQQYYWTGGGTDRSKCSSMVLDNICGHYDCNEESQMMNLLKELGGAPGPDGFTIAQRTVVFVLLPSLVIFIIYRLFGRWAARKEAIRAANNQAECNTLMAGLYAADDSQQFQDPEDEPQA